MRFNIDIETHDRRLGFDLFESPQAKNATYSLGGKEFLNEFLGELGERYSSRVIEKLATETPPQKTGSA